MVVKDTKLKRKLTDLTKSVIYDEKYSDEFSYLFKQLNITEKELIGMVINYTLHVDQIKNEDYASHTMRMVLHLHNLVYGTYHQTRQDAVVNFLKHINPKTAIEVGFGVPSRYVFDLTLKYGNPKLTLIDMDASAIDFAKVLLAHRNSKWKEFVDFKIMNMDNQEFVGDADVYIFMDSIEHTKDPTEYLKKVVKLSSSQSKFILSIPISKIDTLKHAHYAEWLTEEDAEEWLNKCGLFIEKKIVAKPNPKVDFFADLMNGTFYNIIVLANKTNNAQKGEEHDRCLVK